MTLHYNHARGTAKSVDLIIGILVELANSGRLTEQMITEAEKYTYISNSTKTALMQEVAEHNKHRATV